jgi:quercetin dioxygenase-like cupin family protein
MKLLKLATLVSLCLVAGLAQAKPVTAVLPDSPDLKWTAAKDLPGAEVAILMGNPAKKEPFVARIKLPAGYTVPSHSHPVNEYDTVISGTWYLGMGNTINEAETQALPAGSFVRIPAHSLHYGMTKEETIIQINGVGPWGMIYPKKKAG